MAKDPAFLFYSSDWLTGTMMLNWEDKGKYIQLLASMHQHGRLNEETIWLLVGSVSVLLKSKFKIDEEGRWYNERLEQEAKKRSDYQESRRKNGQKGGRPKGKIENHMDNHMRNHMANHTDNDNIDVFKGVVGGMENPKTEVSLEECKRIALLDTRWVAKNKTNPGLLDTFNDFLERGGCYEKTPIDYKTHYRNWNAKKPEQAPVKQITNKLDELKKRYSDPA